MKKPAKKQKAVTSEKVEVNLFCLSKIIYHLNVTKKDERAGAALVDGKATAMIDKAVFDALEHILADRPGLQGFARDCNPWTEPDCIDWG